MSSLPTPYERQANFTSYEASNPSKPKPGASLDAEFNAVQQSLDTTQSRLAEIQRDDGKLANGIVSRDTLDANVGQAIDVVLGNTTEIDDKVAAAQAAAASANISASDAQGYAASALTSATTAASYMNSAETFALDAFSAASTASTHRNAAAASATAAAQSATDAAAAAQTAIPSGALMPYAGANAPNGWLLCAGQTVSRATYAALFDAIGTTYGAGDGSTTFALPDLRGRTIAGKDNMGGTSANRLTLGGSGIIGNNLGAAGGAEAVTLTAAQSGVPAHSHTASSSFSGGATNSAGAHSHTYQYSTLNDNGGGTPSFQGLGTQNSVSNGPVSSAGAHTHTVTGTVSTTVNNSSAANASAAHSNTQPTIVLNYIIKT